MQVLCLPNHPSLRGRDLPRPTRSTLMLPHTTDTDLGHRASFQMTTGSRRAFITKRTNLAAVRTTITTRVLNRGARPRTRIVPADTTPRLASATAGATLGAPRRVAIPGLVGSRGLFPTITCARPAGAPSTGLLRPPRMVLLPLLVDFQEAPELDVHAGTRPPLPDHLQSLGVPHRVRLRPGEQIFRQAPKHVDQRDQERACEKPSRRPTEAPEKNLQPGLTLRPQSRRGVRQESVGHRGGQSQAVGRRNPGHGTHHGRRKVRPRRRSRRLQGHPAGEARRTGRRDQLMTREGQTTRKRRTRTTASLRHGGHPPRRDLDRREWHLGVTQRRLWRDRHARRRARGRRGDKGLLEDDAHPVGVVSGHHREPPIPVPTGSIKTAHGVVEGLVLDRESRPQSQHGLKEVRGIGVITGEAPPARAA